MKTAIQRAFAPFKIILPRFVWTRIRAVATAVFTPVIFSRWSGHFKSSLKGKAVSRRDEPLPWYTYPCIHLLAYREFSGKKILEFGGGQSTLWWAARADEVITFEGDREWHAELSKLIPKNVDLHLVSTQGKEAFLADVKGVIEGRGTFDVIVIDSEYREDVVSVALALLAPNGALICDDAESYGFYEATRGLEIERVDFFGHSPGVVLPHCTSVFFRKNCFLFDAKYRIPDLATEPC